MAKLDISKYAFLVLLLVLAYFSYKVLAPFLSYLLFSIVLVMLFAPAYDWLRAETDLPRLSSLALVLLLILLLVLPSIWVGVNLVRQAPGAYETLVTSLDVQPLEQFLSDTLNTDVSVNEYAQQSVANFRTYVLEQAPGFLSSITEVVIGLFVMFFVMFYLFTQKDDIMKRLREVTPLSKKHSDKLFSSIDMVVHGIIEGQLVTGAVQGVLGGVLFWALGIPNALFWGFVMVVLSVIPFLGSFIVWVPVAGWLFVTGEIVRGIILTAIGVIVISQVDNLLRPYLVGRYAEVHPALVLVGVFGGLKVWGVAGFVLGPLVLALFVAFLKFYQHDVH